MLAGSVGPMRSGSTLILARAVAPAPSSCCDAASVCSVHLHPLRADQNLWAVWTPARMLPLCFLSSVDRPSSRAHDPKLTDAAAGRQALRLVEFGRVLLFILQYYSYCMNGKPPGTHTAVLFRSMNSTIDSHVDSTGTSSVDPLYRTYT